MDEHLLGYLLGALDGPEHESIRRQLERNSDLRRELAELEMRLAPLENERWQHEPPLGLAMATCQLVAQQSAPSRPRRFQLSRAFSEWSPSQNGWDLMDAVVAAGIFFAAALLFFPAIAQSLDQARVMTCQNNLRLNAVALSMFGERNNDVFPYIPASGKTGVAGFYAPQIRHGGYMTDDAGFLCPSSNLAVNAQQGFFIPTVDQIREANGSRLSQLHQTMGGSYMYTLGHHENGRYRSTVNLRRPHFPVLSDGFFTRRDGTMVMSHGGRGMNVAFEGGNVRFMVTLSPDHPFYISDRGLIEAGCGPDDAVLGPSWTKPVPFQSEPL